MAKYEIKKKSGKKYFTDDDVTLHNPVMCYEEILVFM
jgi:hypothetical protein